MPITTTTFLRKDNKILLAVKKRGFGVGKIMGVGGKQEADELIEDTAIREVKEEIGVHITKIERMATVIFDDLYYKDAPERVPMYVFIATEWEGEPSESDEVKPEWYALSDIPYEKMWSDALVYLPRILRGEKFEAYFRYNKKNECVEEWVRSVPEKILARLDDKSVGLPEHEPITPHKSRVTARAVLLDDDGKIGFTCVGQTFFMTPGGGVDDGELIETTLRRELIEEAGYEVDIISPLGRVVEDRQWGNFHQVDFYYLCRTKKFVGTAPTEGEIEKDIKTVWFRDFDEALAAIQSSHSVFVEEYKEPFFIMRDCIALREAQRVLKARKLGRGGLRAHNG